MTEPNSLEALVEAILYASPQPVTVQQLARALRQEESRIASAIERIIAEHNKPEHGVFVRQVRGGYQVGSKPELDQALRQSLRGLRPRAPLSLAALQTLAIIAYRQPISAPEIQRIRRVEGAGVLDTLLRRKLIAPAGHKPDRRALLYKTTPQFLVDFGLKDLKDLPALPDFRELREQYEQHS
jgi:segregation and condensation protein B